MTPTRRTIIRAAGLALAAPAVGRLVPGAAAAGDETAWRHGLSLFGNLKYPAEFRHFDYVNPNAPKGGTLRQIAVGTFDNFNPVPDGVKGNLAGGTGLLFDTLMGASLDEPSSEYGLIAEAARFPPDFSAVTYRLRGEARWHDGEPITPDDVIFSFDAFKSNSPQYAAYYRHVLRGEKTGEREVTFTFDAPGNRELPQIVGQLTVLPRHWFEGRDASGKPRDVTATTLEPPLGSGPYRIARFEAGRNIVYERVKDYWASAVPAMVGTHNFDQQTFVYFRDVNVAFEAFKADQVDWRAENSAKRWATGYDFPAVREKRVVVETFPLRNLGTMQAYAFNVRRPKLADPRVRRAFNFALNFEQINKELFYGQYRRITSYFDGTELASSGLPEGAELRILEGLRDRVPPEVFTTPYANPVGGGAEAVRGNLLAATRLLKEAGYVVRDQKLVDQRTGEQLRVEFLIDDPTYEPFVLFYQAPLERLGIAVTVRAVDDVQYQNRVRQFDFDIVIASWLESLSPGNEQREYWGSAAADTPGSRNLIGIKNPAVDALIDRIIFADDRAGLVAATRALDRVLLWNHYVVPQWDIDKVRTARWDRFARPDPMPTYGADAFPTIWWWDAARAAKMPPQP
ncbi:MAG: extracellular solute-binding protein [Xanthobacteraceae bacterium]